MKRSPIALALVAALGAGITLPSAPVLAQQVVSAVVMPIRTGSSSIPGPIGVRLAVYDARSFELSWDRVANAVTYRLAVGSRVVQENGAVSRYVSGIDVSGGFDYTLTALNRAGTALATRRFRVQPVSTAQLVAAGGGTATPATPVTPTGPAQPSGDTSPPTNLRLQVYSGTAAELFWQPGPFVDRNEIRRDGVLIGTLGGGFTSSYFDDTRRPGRSYTYEVTAINGGGRGFAAIGDTGGTGTPTAPTNPMAPVTPMSPATGPIRTGISNVGGDFPVRLAVYDAQSFELSWQRVPGAATYRLSRGGQVVQESNGLSRYVSGVNSSASFAYTLVALDRGGRTLRSTSFTVAPRAATQLVAGGGGTSTPTNPTTPMVNNGPIRTGQTSLPGDLDVRLSVYDAKAYELFWFRVPGAARYRLSRDGQVVQESDAVSFFVGNADSTRRFAYTLEVLDRSGSLLRRRSFTVAPRGTPQLFETGSGTSTPTNPVTPTNPDAEGSPAGDFAVVTNAADGIGGVVFYSPDLATPDAARQMIQAGANQGIAFAPDGTLYQNSDVAGAEGLYRIDADGSAVALASFPGKGLSYIDSSRDYLASCDVTASSADLRLFEVIEGAELPLASTDIDLAAPCWDTFWDKPNDRLYIALTDGELAVMDDFSADAGANFVVDRTIIPANELLEPASTNLHGIALRVRGGFNEIYVSDVGNPASATDGRIFIFPDDGSRDGPTIATEYSIYGPDTMLGNPVDILLVNDVLIVAEKSNDLLLAFDVTVVRDQEGNMAPIYAAPFDKPESIELVTGR